MPKTVLESACATSDNHGQTYQDIRLVLLDLALDLCYACATSVKHREGAEGSSLLSQLAT